MENMRLLTNILLGALIIFILSELSYRIIGNRFVGIALGVAISSLIKVKQRIK